jgi:hypothetical protein
VGLRIYTSRVKLVIDKRRPEAYWPAERWRFSALRGMTTDVDLLLVTPLFWVRFFRIRRGASA